MADTRRTRYQEMSAEHAARGDATGWFDVFYREAAGDLSAIPWADLRPMDAMVEWLDGANVSGRALVPGCGLGDDAEELSRRGMAVTAFDIAPEAVAWCQRRFPESAVSYVVADAAALPAEWSRSFELVVEISTLQVLPAELRLKAAQAIAGCVAPGGHLIVICRGRDADDDPGTMPWPLTWEDLAIFESYGLTLIESRDFLDDDSPPVRRFLACYTRT